MKIYDIYDPLAVREQEPDAPVPAGWTDVPPLGVAKPQQFDGQRWRVTTAPADRPQPPPKPYAELTRVEFLDALQEHGGVSDANLVASRADANLGAFWLKLEMAVSIARDDAKTTAGLDALISLGFLDASGKQAVLDNWPRA